MKFHCLEVSEEEVKKAGEEVRNQKYKKIIIASLVIVAIGIFWLMAAISYIVTKQGSQYQVVIGFVLFGVCLVAAAIYYFYQKNKLYKQDVMDFGREIYEEKGKEAEAAKKAEDKHQAELEFQRKQKEFNNFLITNKNNYEKDESIDKWIVAFFLKKELEINGYTIDDVNIKEKVKFPSEYVEKYTVIQYELYLKKGQYKINGYPIDLNGTRSDDNFIIVYGDEKPVLNSPDYLKECSEKAIALMTEQVNEILKTTVVKEDIYGPVMIKDYDFLKLAEYQYTRTTYHYADGHEEVVENKKLIRYLD